MAAGIAVWGLAPRGGLMWAGLPLQLSGINGNNGIHGIGGSGVKNGDSDPTFHARRGPG